MSGLRIGIFLENRITHGGAFQQSISTIKAFADSMPEFEMVALTPHAENISKLRDAGVAAQLYVAGWRGRLDGIQALSLPTTHILSFLRRLGFRRLGRHLDYRLTELGIDVAIFSNYTTALRLSDHPFVVTVWDLCHRDLPEFPGVSLGREFERREQCLRIALPKALAVIVNCPSHAQRIHQIYQVATERIVLLPFLPSLPVRRYAEGKGLITVEAVRARYGLHEDYVFYPAQICADKNHVYVLDALVALEKKYGHRLHAAFSGADTGNRSHVEEYARRKGLAQRVHFLGFVEDEEIPALYAGARALTMPTYGGPTNLPPLEAAVLGCPVIYSDLPDWRTFMGAAALYCDLADPQSMADHLHALMTDSALVQSLRDSERKLVAAVNEERYSAALRPVMKNFEYVRRRWGR